MLAYIQDDLPSPETNSEFTPENGWLEYELRFLLEQKAYFQERTVSFRECKVQGIISQVIINKKSSLTKKKKSGKGYSHLRGNQ